MKMKPTQKDRRAHLDRGGKRVPAPPVSYHKPMDGKRVFLDLKGRRGIALLEDNLKLLGAVVDKCFSKDVHVLVTTRGTEKDYALSKRDAGPCASAATPSPFNLAAVRRAIDSPQADSPGGADGSKPLTRGQKIARQANLTKYYGTDVLENARRWKIRIVAFEKVRKWVESEMKKVPASVQEGLSKPLKEHKKHKSPTVRRLKGAHLKFEDSTKVYRPQKREFDKGFPKINLDSPAGSFPFDMCPPGVDVRGGDERAERCMEKEANELAELGQSTRGTNSQGAQKKKSNQSSQKRKSTTQKEAGYYENLRFTPGDCRRIARESLRALQKAGYCEQCDMRYHDIDKHVRCDQHREFIRNSDNFKSLDQLIEEGPNIERFLADVQKYQKVHRREAESVDSEVLVLSEPDSPCTRSRLRHCAASAEKARRQTATTKQEKMLHRKEAEVVKAATPRKKEVSETDAKGAWKKSVQSPKQQSPSRLKQSRRSPRGKPKALVNASENVATKGGTEDVSGCEDNLDKKQTDFCLGQKTEECKKVEEERNNCMNTGSSPQKSSLTPRCTQRSRRILTAQNAQEVGANKGVKEGQGDSSQKDPSQSVADAENSRQLRESPRKSLRNSPRKSPCKSLCNSPRKSPRKSPGKPISRTRLSSLVKKSSRKTAAEAAIKSCSSDRITEEDLVNFQKSEVIPNSNNSGSSALSTVIDFLCASPQGQTHKNPPKNSSLPLVAEKVGVEARCKAASEHSNGNENVGACLGNVSRAIILQNKERTSLKRRRHLNFEDKEAEAGQPRKKLKRHWSVISQRSISKLFSSESDKSFNGFPSSQSNSELSYSEVSEAESTDSIWLLNDKPAEQKKEKETVKVLEEEEGPIVQQLLFGLSEPSSEWDKQLDSYLETRMQHKAKEGSINTSLVASETTISKPPDTTGKGRTSLPQPMFRTDASSAKAVLNQAFAGLLGDDQGESFWEASSPRAQRHLRRAASGLIDADIGDTKNIEAGSPRAQRHLRRAASGLIDADTGDTKNIEAGSPRAQRHLRKAASGLIDADIGDTKHIEAGSSRAQWHLRRAAASLIDPDTGDTKNIEADSPRAQRHLRRTASGLIDADTADTKNIEAGSPRAQRHSRRAALDFIGAETSDTKNTKNTEKESYLHPPKHSTPVRESKKKKVSKMKAFSHYQPSEQRETRQNKEKVVICLSDDDDDDDDAKSEDDHWSLNSQLEGVEHIDEDIEFNFSSPGRQKPDFSLNLPSPIPRAARQRRHREKRTCSLPATKTAMSNRQESLSKSAKCANKPKRLLKSASTTEKSFSLDFMRGSSSSKKKPKKLSAGPKKTERATENKEDKEARDKSFMVSPLSMSVLRKAALGLRSSPRKARALFQVGDSNHSSPSCRTDNSLSNSVAATPKTTNPVKSQCRLSMRSHAVQFASNLAKSYRAKTRDKGTAGRTRASLQRKCTVVNSTRRKRQSLQRTAKATVCYEFTSGSEL